MKRHFNALSWSEWTWQRPFSEEDVKSLLGQLGNKGISKSKEKQVIISYLEEEMTVRDIASKFQISTATIYSVLRRNNIRTNRKY